MVGVDKESLEVVDTGARFKVVLMSSKSKIHERHHLIFFISRPGASLYPPISAILQLLRKTQNNNILQDQEAFLFSSPNSAILQLLRKTQNKNILQDQEAFLFSSPISAILQLLRKTQNNNILQDQEAFLFSSPNSAII